MLADDALQTGMPEGGAAGLSSGLSLRPSQSKAPTLEPLLSGRIAQALDMVYREAGRDLPARSLGEQIAAWHNELVAEAMDPADQLVLLGEKLAEVRRQLRA